MCMFYRSLFVLLSYISFGHCVVCSSSIYEFWLPLCYLQTLLNVRTLMVILQSKYLDCNSQSSTVMSTYGCAFIDLIWFDLLCHPGPLLLLKHWTLSHTFNRWRKLAYIEKKLWKNFIQKTKRGRNHLHFENIEVYRRFFGEFRVFHLCSILCYRFRFLLTSVSSHCKGGLISRIKKELSWWCLLGPQN
jgi:hypothetical protein